MLQQNKPLCGLFFLVIRIQKTRFREFTIIWENEMNVYQPQ